MSNQEFIIDNGLFPSKALNFTLSESYETIANTLKTLKEYRGFSQPGESSWDEYIEEIFHVLGFGTKKLDSRLLALNVIGELDSKKALMGIVHPGENMTLIIPDLEWDTLLFYAANYWKVYWGILTNGLEIKIGDFATQERHRKYYWCNLEAIIEEERVDSFFNLYKVFAVIKGQKEEPKIITKPLSRGTSTIKPQRTNGNSILLVITQGALTHSYMNVASNLSFFPTDSIGASSAKYGLGKMLKLHVDGLSLPIETDIAGDKKFFRERGWCADFYRVHALQPGDEVLIERLSEYEYRVSPGKKA